VSEALRDNGLFVFNTEITTEAEFKMNQSGRFSHHKNYLDRLAEKNHLKIAYYKVEVTRLQNNEPVEGHIYVLKK
jgi:predicted TPR repeat methyltransferase